MRVLVALVVLCLPVAAAAQTTHYVTAGGNPSSNCTMGDPCTFTRAFDLGDTATIACGDTVSVAAGYYFQAELVWGTGKACTGGLFVKYVGDTGAVVTGLETKPSAAGFSLTTSQTYTYEIAWDESSTFTVGLVAQQGEPSTWLPLTVRDAANVQFDLESPINYTERASIAEVELHRCTFWNDTAVNKVYVHMCHNGAPHTDDELYFGRARWGGVIIQGDDLWWQNIDLQHSTFYLGASSGEIPCFLLESTAQRTRVLESAFRSCSFEPAGNDSVFTDLVIEHNIRQGAASAGCDDEDSGITGALAPSCFNASASGVGMLMGINGSSASANQTASFITARKNWNGIHVAGANTLTDFTLWGHPNHSLTWNGTGGTIRTGVSANAQDSGSANGAQWDQLTIENVLFLHDVVAHISHAQEAGDPAWTPTTSWTFRNNILPYLLVEDLTTVGLSMSCNLFIEDIDGGGVDVISLNSPYSGGLVFDYSSFAAFLAGQPTLATNSAGLTQAKWTDGTQFADFVNQQAPTFSFASVAGAQIYSMDGACGRVGPFASIPPPATHQGRRLRFLR